MPTRRDYSFLWDYAHFAAFKDMEYNWSKNGREPLTFFNKIVNPNQKT